MFLKITIKPFKVTYLKLYGDLAILLHADLANVLQSYPPVRLDRTWFVQV